MVDSPDQTVCNLYPACEMPDGMEFIFYFGEVSRHERMGDAWLMLDRKYSTTRAKVLNMRSGEVVLMPGDRLVRPLTEAVAEKLRGFKWFTPSR